jgi:hypothetical protein
MSTAPSLPGVMGTPAFFMRASVFLSPIGGWRAEGPMKRDVAAFADLREVGVLGEESVAGVDGVGAGDLGGADDRRDLEVAFGGGRPDADGSSATARA